MNYSKRIMCYSTKKNRLIISSSNTPALTTVANTLVLALRYGTINSTAKRYDHYRRCYQEKPFPAFNPPSLASTPSTLWDNQTKTVDKDASNGTVSLAFHPIKMDNAGMPKIRILQLYDVMPFRYHRWWFCCVVHPFFLVAFLLLSTTEEMAWETYFLTNTRHTNPLPNARYRGGEVGTRVPLRPIFRNIAWMTRGFCAGDNQLLGRVSVYGARKVKKR